MLPSSIPPQAETWPAQHPHIRACVPALSDLAKRQTPYCIGHAQEVGNIDIEQATGVAFFGATPHTDTQFPRYFVQLVISARPDLLLHTRPTKRVPKSGAPAPVSALSVPLILGHMLGGDAHKLQWVDPPGPQGAATADFNLDEVRPSLGVVIGVECDERPSREQAEELLWAYLKRNTPRVVEGLGLSEPPRRPRP